MDEQSQHKFLAAQIKKSQNLLTHFFALLNSMKELSPANHH